MKWLTTILMLLSYYTTQPEESSKEVASVGDYIKIAVVESFYIEEKRPHIEGLPDSMTNEILDYIWKKSIESGFDYFYLLAIAKTESEFNLEAESHTRDSGLYQIHRPTAKWISQKMGLNEYDLHDPFTSIDFAVYYLSTLRDAWSNKGLSEEEMFDVITISYNRGVAGANKYIKKYGIKNNKYLKTVMKNKEELELMAIG